MPSKISVIVPSFNQGAFLEECIVSVIEQDWESKEIIIMDGGSKDQSVEIIKKYERHITYWQSQKDGGQTPAINAGFQRSTGVIVGWLNSDDAFKPGALYRAANAFSVDPGLAIAQGAMEVMDEGTREVTVRRNLGKIDFHRMLNGRFKLNQPGSFFRRSLMMKAGPLDESLNYVMDYEYWLRLSKLGAIQEIDDIQSMHRMHPDCKTMGDFASTFVPEIRRVRARYGGSILSLKEWDLLRIRAGAWRRTLMGSGASV